MKKNYNKLITIIIALVTVVILGILLIIYSPWPKRKLENWTRSKIVAYVDNNTKYSLTIDTLLFINISTIELRSVNFIPKEDKKTFNKNIKFQSDWINFRAKRIVVVGIFWKNWFNDKGIRMQNIEIYEPNLYVYRDKRLPGAPPKDKPLPMHFIRNASSQLTIPTIVIKGGRILYEEQSRDGISDIRFAKCDINVKNLSSDHEELKKDAELVLEGEGLFLDSIPTQMVFKTNILNEQNKYFLGGSAKGFDASLLNHFLVPMAKVQISEGYINKADFEFEADDEKASGVMLLDYKGIQVEVYDKEKKKSSFKTFLSNLLIRDKNVTSSKDKEENRKGKIFYVREKNHSIFHYWLQAIKSGVFSVVSEVKPESIQKAIKKTKKTNHKKDD